MSGLESVIENDRVPSFGAVEPVRKQEGISQEVQAFVDNYRQATDSDDLQVTKENITRYAVEPVRMHTKLMTLANQVKGKRSTLILDALKCLHKHDEEQSKIAPIAAEYKLDTLASWNNYI